MPDFETVEPQETEAVADDAQLEALEEEADTSLPLEDALSDEPEKPAQEKPDAQGTSEPGWIKKRVDKAVQKAVAETEARMKAQFDAQMKPFLDWRIEQEAQVLVRQGEFKSLDRAKEYLQLKQGLPMPQPAQQQQQPRNERGQFTSSKPDPTINARADILAKQAQKIKSSQGLDVMSVFDGDEEVKAKIISGEWDFYDVAEAMKNQPARKKASVPMRSPNGASGAEKSTIASMSDEQFDRLDRKIAEGARYNLR